MMRAVLIYNNTDYPKGQITVVRTFNLGYREVNTFPESNLMPFVFGIAQNESVELQTTWISYVDGDDVFDADKRKTSTDGYLKRYGEMVIA